MKTATLALALALGSAACGRAAPAWPPVPTNVQLGEDACANCRMIVSDGRFGAQARRRAQADTALVFDDLGCLLAAAKSAPFEAQGVFVRQFDGDGWLRGDEAFVVRSKEIASPMGFGFAAFATRDAAENEAARRPGAVVSGLEELLTGNPAVKR